MDSTAEDPTLPINFDESTNLSRLPDVTTGPDFNMSNFGEHFSESNGGPGFQKIGSGRISPVRAHTMKDYEQQIAELKKENFSLKLRIYFMEERLQQNFNDDAKTNIELRVEVESLKNDLREKQQLLIKASNAVESLAHEKDSIVEKMTKEKKQEAQVNGNKLHEDLRQALEEAETLKSANEELCKKLEEAQKLQQQLSDKNLQTQSAQVNNKEALAEKDRVIDQLNNALKNKDDVIDQINKEKSDAQAELKPREDELKELQDKLKETEDELEALQDNMEREQSDKDATKTHYKELYLEQEKRLHDLETATEALQDKLKDKDKAIKDMQNKLKKAQQEVKEANGKLRENERELQKQEGNANKRDRAIQGLTAAVKGKDEEIKHLCDQIEDQEDALAKAREKLHQAERSRHESIDGQRSTIDDLETNMAEMRGKLRAKDLENERLQKALGRRQDEIARLREEQGSGDSQMDNLLASKDKTIQDLKDQLQNAKDQISGRVGLTEEHYQDLLEDAQQQLQNKEHTNQRLTDALQKKDQVIKEYVDFAKSAKSSPPDGKESKDKTVDKLKAILQQRDKELEDALEDKFIAVQAKEDEIRQIRQALRERVKELERLNNDLLHSNDRINELESEVKEKDAKTRQLANSLKAKNDAMNNADEGHQRAIAEKDSILRKLQHALADKDRLSEEMKSLGNGSPREDETNAIIKQLSQRLKNKDKLIEEMVAERAEAAEANEKATRDLLGSLQDKDRQIKALHDRHNKLIADKNEIIKALQREIANKDMDIQSVEDTLARSQQDQSILLGKMRAAMAEKDKTIERLVESGQEKDKLFQDMQRSTPPPSASPDLNAMKNEIGRLRREIKARDAVLNELRANCVSKDHLKALENDLETKNDLLEKARETINALQQNQRDHKQAKLELAKLRRKVIELESELEAKQDHIDALVHAGKVKDNIIKELRLQQPKHTMSSHDTIDGQAPNDQLYQALAAQVREMENLNKALKAERQLYVNITHNGDSKNTTHNDAFEIELAAVQSLRKQLEQALKRNNRMRENLERQVSSQTLSDLDSEHTTSNENELQALRDRLEESQRWNADLQSRVKDLQQRGGGVGSDADSDVIRINTAQSQASSRPPPVEEIISVRNVDVMSPKELKEEVMKLQLQLLEANRRSLDDDLRSIPGQEETLTGGAKQSKKEIEKLKDKNKELEQEIKILEQRLASSPGRGDGLDETDSHVVPVLKQQLDQAKSLLQDKDTLLQEKEQQNQALRHHLGIGPESPIQPGRNVMTTLQRENSQLASQLHKAQHQKKELQDELDGLESQLREAEKMSSAMQKQLKSASANTDSANLVPILKQKLIQAKEIIQERETQNKALQQALKKRSPDKNQLGQLQAENEQLKSQLIGYNKELQNMKSQFQTLEKELEEVQNSRPPPSAHIEIERLQKQLRNAENLNELLKRHIDLNSSSEGEQPSFNPELIVDMAKEIERLKDTLDETQKELSTDSPLKTRVGTRVKALDDTAYGTLTKQLEQAHCDLNDLKKRYKQLNSKLQATEGTVRQQSDRIRRYRQEMQDAGIQVPRTPKRYHSDSNLLRAHFDNISRKLSGASLLSPDDRSGSTSPSPSERSHMVDISLSEFGQTNDVSELKSQVDTLKLHLQRSRRALRSLQSRLRNRSNTSSPARVASPSRTDSSSLDGGGAWFELVANQQAFEKLQQEVESLRDQVEEASNVNMTLQEHNNDLVEKVNSNIPVPPGLLAHNEQLIKENEAEIVLLKQQLEDSQQLCSTLRGLIDEALSAMEEISQKREEEKDNSPSEMEKARQKVKKSKIMAEDLGKVLGEHMSRTSDQSRGDILENRRKAEIQQLKKEIKQRKELNQKLRDLLGENKKSADETRKELERIAKEVHEKNETITKLRRQVRHLQAMGSFSSTNSRPISETEDTSSMQFQTTANTESMQPGDDGDATDTELDLPFDISHQERVGRSHQHFVGSGLQHLVGSAHASSDGGESQDTVKDQFEQLSDSIDIQGGHLPKMSASSRLKRGTTIGRMNEDDSSEAAVQTRVTWAHKDATTASTQTSQMITSQPDMSRLQARLHQSEKQVETLNSELDLYKHLLADSPKISGMSDSAILKQHLEEIRALRKRLEESITVNDRLREQLETKLAELSNGGGDTDIFIYQSNVELTEENKLLKERLHEKDSAFHDIVEELKKNKRQLQKLKAQNQHLTEQLQENIDLVGSLKFELNILEQLHQKDAKSSSASPGYIHIKDASGLDLSELLHEIRRLRVQLERSIETNNALRQKLEEVMREKWSPSSKTSVTSVTINSKDKKQSDKMLIDELTGNRRHVTRQLFNGENASEGSPSRSTDPLRNSNPALYRSTDDIGEKTSGSSRKKGASFRSPQKSFGMHPFDADIMVDPTLIGSEGTASNYEGSTDKMYAIGTLPTYESLRAFLNESRISLNALELHLKEKLTKEGTQTSLSGWSHGTQTLRRHLEECVHYLSLFWSASLPPKDELSRLRKKLLYQDKVMKSTLKTLESTNRMKEGMESAIYNQLAKTHDVLKQARGNLQADHNSMI